MRFSQTITGLRPGTRYEYQLCVKVARSFSCRGPDGTSRTAKKFTARRRKSGSAPHGNGSHGTGSHGAGPPGGGSPGGGAVGTGSPGGGTAGTGSSGGGTAGSGADPSGQAMPSGDIPGWHQVFADNFSTPVPFGSFPAAVASRWSDYSYPAHDSSGNGTYWPEKVVSIGGGVMDLYLHTEAGIHAVAAPQPKITPTDPYGQLYGRYSVRFRTTNSTPCYRTAWLLWPDDGVWPAHGEIDFPEASLDGVETMSAFVHYAGSGADGAQDTFNTGAMYDVWHTATTEWTPGQVSFYLDGSLIGSSSHSPSTAMHWVLQTETGLGGCVPADSTVGHVQIDWVVAYARS